REVPRIVAPREQPGMDFRVQRLDAAVEHLGEPGVRRDLGHRDAFLFQQLRSAAGGQELHAERSKCAGELDNAGLVGDAEKRPADLRHYPLIRSCCIFLRSVLRVTPSISAASDWLPSALPSTVSIIGFSMFFSTIS